MSDELVLVTGGTGFIGVNCITAQVVNGNFKVGINSDAAPQNAQFVLNLVRWLD